MAEITAVGFKPVDKAGDTMQGPLTLAGAPTTDLEAATKQYVDNALSSFSPAVDWGDIGGNILAQIDLSNALDDKANVADLEAYATLFCNLTATTDPTTANDDTQGYEVGSRWINTAGQKEFVCVDNATGAAVWEETTGGGAAFNRYTYETTSVGSSLEFRSGTATGATRIVKCPNSGIFGSETWELSSYNGSASIPVILPNLTSTAMGDHNHIICLRNSNAASEPLLNFSVGAFRTPYVVQENNYIFQVGGSGIDTGKSALTVVQGRVYFIPFICRTISLGRVSVGVESITGTADLRVRAYNLNAVGVNSVGTSAITGALSLSVSAAGIHVPPSLFGISNTSWIAIQFENVTDTLNLAGCVDSHPGELLSFLGSDSKTSGVPIYGYYKDGLSSLSSVFSLGSVVMDGVLTEPLGVCVGRD